MKPPLPRNMSGTSRCRRARRLSQPARRVWLALLCIAALPHARAQYPFQFTIVAAGTANTTTSPELPFLWSGTANATETYTTTEPGHALVKGAVSVSTRGDTPAQAVRFVAPQTGVAQLTYELRSSGSGSASFSLQRDDNHSRITTANIYGSDARTGSHEFGVQGGQAYVLWLAVSPGPAIGDATARGEVRFPALVDGERTALRTTSTQGAASVAAGAPRTVGAIPSPAPERGGKLGPINYSATSSQPLVRLAVSGNQVVASTTFTETRPVPWSHTESGSGSLTGLEGEVLIHTSALRAPNGDTAWSVTDDSPVVATRMVGNQVFARVVAAAGGTMVAPLVIHRAVDLEFTTVAGSVYQLQRSTDLARWLDQGPAFVGRGGPTNLFLRAGPEAAGFLRILRLP